jgi:hypothetical protein
MPQRLSIGLLRAAQLLIRPLNSLPAMLEHVRHLLRRQGVRSWQ